MSVIDIRLADDRDFIRRETTDDIALETRLANYLCKQWKVNLRKLRSHEVIDYCAERNGKPVGWVELKCRTTPVDQYPTYMIGLHKLAMGLQYNAISGLPFILAVGFADGEVRKLVIDDYREPVWRSALECRFGGRRDRQWTPDMEMCVFIDMQAMEPM